MQNKQQAADVLHIAVFYWQLLTLPSAVWTFVIGGRRHLVITSFFV